MLAPPGVYVHETRGGPTPIPGIATSNTAFVGVLGRGPVAVPTRITSWGEFERMFGGLQAGYETSYALRDYFLNGGRVAFVVRVANGATTASINLPANGGGITLAASSPGAWGNGLRVGTLRDTDAGGTGFDLLIREYRGEDMIREEAFSGLSTSAADPRHVTRVLAAESQLVTVTADAGGDRTEAAHSAPDIETLRHDPTALTALTGGADGALPADSDDFAALTASAHIPAIHALERIDPEIFNLMCLPDIAVLGHARRAAAAAVYQAANGCCERNLAFLIIDSLIGTTRDNIGEWTAALGAGVRRNAALYHPQLTGADPLNPARNRSFAASGAVAGTIARIDAARGVWQAPAGTTTTISGAQPIETISDAQQRRLNDQGINVIRNFPVHDTLIWGARTLDGAAALASEWKYIPVRRLALHIESSLSRGLQWALFEPNGEPLWALIRLGVTDFMSQLFRRGAFQGASARDAFLVKCDAETTSQADIGLGVLNILVGFAAIRPGEFIILRIRQHMQRNA